MSSSWPTTVDALPGIPYTDNIQYIVAAYANAWAASITQIETIIGYGIGNNAANPLYSVPFATGYPTITARLNATESTLAALPPLDLLASDIQPVAATASAGNSGKYPDAKHQHVGVASYNGRVGTVTSQPGDVTSIFQHKGDLIVGTGPGTGEVLAGPPGTGVGYTLVFGGGVDPSGLQWQQAVWLTGDIKPTAAVGPAPVGWSLADGTAHGRTDPQFANLFAATTIQVTALLTIGSSTLTSISPIGAIAQVWAGMPAEGPGIPAGTTVIQVLPSSIVLSANVAAPGGNQTVTFFPYGNGNGSTTFNVIDMRGATTIGAGQAPGRTNRIVGAPVGGQESTALSTSQLPLHFHAVNDPLHQHANNLTTLGENATHTHLTIAGFGYQVMVAYPFSTVNFEWGPPGDGRIPITVTPGEAPPGSVPAIEWGTIPENPTTSAEEQAHMHGFSDNIAATGLTVGNAVDSRGVQAQGQPFSNMPPSVVVQYLVKL